jgi:hypothetical protein
MDNKGYNGNLLIKTVGAQQDWTLDQVQEWTKCKEDPIYFIEKYIKIVTLDYGLQPMKLYPFQRDIILGIVNNNKVIACCARQLGKCVDKNTKYTVRNKKTGEIRSLTAQEFHEQTKKTNPI